MIRPLLPLLLLLSLLLLPVPRAQAFADLRQARIDYPSGRVDLYVTPGQCAIALDGLLDEGAARALDSGFRRLQAMGCRSAVMLLNSSGGTPAVGYLVADFLDRLGFDTVIADGAQCFSACAYAFLGGRRRHVAPQGRFGVHQHSRGQACARELSDGETARLGAILRRALPAASARELGETIMATACTDMHVIPRAGLERLSVTNSTGPLLDAALGEAIARHEAQIHEQFRREARGPWTRVAGDRVLVVHVREAAPAQQGGAPRVWGLIEYAADQIEPMSGGAYRSQILLSEVDCVQKTIALVRGVYSREPAGEGAAVWQGGRGAPVAVQPKTPAALFYRTACGRPLPP